MCNAVQIWFAQFSFEVFCFQYESAEWEMVTQLCSQKKTIGIKYNNLL